MIRVRSRYLKYSLKIMSRRSTEGIKLASLQIFFHKLNTDVIGKFRGQIENDRFPIFAIVRESILAMCFFKTWWLRF